MNFFRLFTIRQKNIHQAALFLALFSLASAVLGLFRDRFLAGHFGASRELDIYYAAFRIPDLVYTMALFLTATTALIPIFIERYEMDTRRGRELMGSVILSAFFVVAVLGIIVYFFLPYIVRSIFSGFSSFDQNRVVELSRIMLLSPLFLAVSNVVASLLQAFKNFFVYALAPVFYNLGIIFGILVLVPLWGLRGLAIGVVVGALFHLAVQIPALVHRRVTPIPAMPWTPDVRRVIALSFPRTLGLSVNQIVWMALTGLGSFLVGGSIAVFNLATNLQSLPLTLIGTSYSIAVFPYLVSLYVRGDHGAFFKHAEDALRQIIFWAVLFMSLFLVLRAHIVRAVLGAGEFGWVDTRLTAALFGVLSISIVFQSAVLLFSRSFYAQGKTKAPVLVNVASSFVIFGAAWYFVGAFLREGVVHDVFSAIFRLEDIVDISVLGLGVGVLLGSVVNAVVLGFLFYKNDGLSMRAACSTIMGAIVASFIAGTFAYGALSLMALVGEAQTFFSIMVHGAGAGIIGLGAAATFLHLTHNREFFEIVGAAKTRFWESGVVAPEPEKLEVM